MDINFADGIDRIALNIFDNLGGPLDLDEEGHYKELLRSRHDYHQGIKEALAGKKSCGVKVIRSQGYPTNPAFRPWSENTKLR